MSLGLILVGCASHTLYQRHDPWEPIGTQWKLRVQMTPMEKTVESGGEQSFELNAEILRNSESATDSANVDSVAIMYAPLSAPEILHWQGSPETYSRNRIIERVLVREPLPPTIACRVFYKLYEQGKRPASGARDYPISR